jgi:hypothetical protein
VDLFRQCLDLQLLDRKKRRMGRVDGIILELEPDRPPRVAYVEVGLTTVADRFSIYVRRRIISLMKRLGIRTDRSQIAWGKIKIGVNEVTADVDAKSTSALAVEMWLRKNIIGKIPGA